MTGTRVGVRVVSKLGNRGRFLEELKGFCHLATHACTGQWLGSNDRRIVKGR